MTSVHACRKSLQLSDLDGITPISYSIFLDTILDFPNQESSVDYENEIVIFNHIKNAFELIPPIPSQKLWIYILYYRICMANVVSNKGIASKQLIILHYHNNIILYYYDISDNVITLNTSSTGTHFLQNITFDNSTSGQIKISGDILKLQLKGFLAIAYGSDGVHYGIANHINTTGKASVTLSRLSMSKYNVSLFIVKEDGVPFTESADVAHSVTVHTDLSNSKISEGIANINSYLYTIIL